MTALIDARSLPNAAVLEPDIAIIGGGPAGISLALALAGSKLNVVLLESGGMSFDPQIQKMYSGGLSGWRYTPLDAGRLRFLGGSTNHWGGYCRPLDEVDFQQRDWMPHSGWPISRKTLEAYYPRAQSLVEAGPWLYDGADGTAMAAGKVRCCRWGRAASTPAGSSFPRRATACCRPISAIAMKPISSVRRNVTPYVHANVTGIRLTPNGQMVDHLDVATLDSNGGAGKHFTIKPRVTVLACGGMENARLLLASNDVMKTGVGNQNDLVGRFFADNPVPRDVATLVSFAGPLASYYGDNRDPGQWRDPAGGVFARPPISAAHKGVSGSLTTIEQPAELDETGKAAVITTALALGVDASNAKAYSLGCGMELAPDPDRRLVLTGEKDALGLPRLKLDMRIADSDFAHYRRTLAELGRQLLASKAGMLRLSFNQPGEWMKTMDWGNHHLGTTRMSEDPKQGVVDSDGKVHGVGNLHIAGSSVFPTYGASNPTLNLIALTLRLGDHLKKVMA